MEHRFHHEDADLVAALLRAAFPDQGVSVSIGDYGFALEMMLCTAPNKHHGARWTFHTGCSEVDDKAAFLADESPSRNHFLDKLATGAIAAFREALDPENLRVNAPQQSAHTH